MGQEWGPWIEHDGAHGPSMLCPTLMQIRQYHSGTDGKASAAEFTSITSSFPGFYWRWKKVRIGWFKTEFRRICDNPDYAPIISYRFLKPPSAAAQMLRDIVAQPDRRIAQPTERERKFLKEMQE